MNAISLSRGSINAGAIFLWQTMAFYIKVWNFTYFAIKWHTFMLIHYLVGQLENREKLH